MQLANAAGQRLPLVEYVADGIIASGSAPQLILPAMQSRSSLLIQNNHASAMMWIEKGPARAHATISSGAVNQVIFNTQGLDNAGFNYSLAPTVLVLGGFGNYVTPSSWPGSAGSENWEGPQGPGQRAASIIAVISGGALASFVIEDPGKGYVNPPRLILQNHPADPFGCADPSLNSGTGLQITGGGSAYTVNGTIADTGQVAIFCSTSSAPFTARYTL